MSLEAILTSGSIFLQASSRSVCEYLSGAIVSDLAVERIGKGVLSGPAVHDEVQQQELVTHQRSSASPIGSGGLSGPMDFGPPRAETRVRPSDTAAGVRCASLDRHALLATVAGRNE